MYNKSGPIYNIAFYNLENLFDPEEKDHTLDQNFTPKGVYEWGEARYRNKIDNLSLAISSIGREESNIPPLFLGVCEVENARCLKDLVCSERLEKHNYGYVHFESPDRRGLDTAFLYQKEFFTIYESKPIRVDLQSLGIQDNTRDILYIRGSLFSENLHILINHWPSRLDGIETTQPKRNTTARALNSILDSIYQNDPSSKIMILGDFNDDPSDPSMGKINESSFFNPLGQNRSKNVGSARYKGKWVLFDQILINKYLMDAKNLQYKKSEIFNPPFLIQNNGRHKGYPKRSFIGKYHLGGFSDHFPVYSSFQLLS